MYARCECCGMLVKGKRVTRRFCNGACRVRSFRRQKAERAASVSAPKVSAKAAGRTSRPRARATKSEE
jgi:hypothetical protein